MRPTARHLAALALIVTTPLGVAYGDDDAGKRLAFETVERGTTSRFARALERVVETRADYLALFDGAPPDRRIDFDRERAAVVAAGTNGADLAVTDVVRKKGKPPVVELVVTERPADDHWGLRPVTRPVHVVVFPRVEGATHVFVRRTVDRGEFDRLVAEVWDPKLKRTVDTLTFTNDAFTHEHWDGRTTRTSRRKLGADEASRLAGDLITAELDTQPAVIDRKRVEAGADFVLTLRRERGGVERVVRLVPYTVDRFYLFQVDPLVRTLRGLAQALVGPAEEGDVTLIPCEQGKVLRDGARNEYDAGGSFRYVLSGLEGKPLRIRGERRVGVWGHRGRVEVRAIVARARTSRWLSPRIERGETILVVGGHGMSETKAVIRRGSKEHPERDPVPLSDLTFGDEPRASASGLVPGLPR